MFQALPPPQSNPSSPHLQKSYISRKHFVINVHYSATLYAKPLKCGTCVLELGDSSNITITIDSEKNITIAIVSR